jgi:hypothetical protein
LGSEVLSFLGRRWIVKASSLAKTLASKFLSAGQFLDSGGPVHQKAFASATKDIPEISEPAFAGLSIQAIGYAEGPPASLDEDESADDLPDEVHIYATRGGRKELNALSKIIEGNRVVVHNTGIVAVRDRAAAASSNRGLLFERGGRIACGSSCAPSGKAYAGTLGALVRRNGKPDLYALSNNHVFGDCNHVSPGMPILSPAAGDSQPAPARAPGMICQHENVVELRSGTPDLVPKCQADLAIALVPNEDAVSSWQGGKDGYDTPTVAGAPGRGLRVKKVGRTTGLTHGIIEAKVIVFRLPYEAEYFKAWVWFTEVWTVRPAEKDPFSLGGDSGSLVVTEDGNCVVGMVFAGSSKGTMSYILPVDCLVSAFGGLQFVTNHRI